MPKLKPTLTADDYHTLAASRGIEWIGGEVPQNSGKFKTRWRCPNGHEWEVAYGNIQSGNGCFYCSPTSPLTPDDYRALAERRGFTWVETSRKLTTSTKNLWRCPNGHEWEATYGNIKKGSGCPHCLDYVNGSPVSKPQREICKLINGQMNIVFKRTFAIDVTVEVSGVRIAIEYDSWYWHQHTLEHDKRKTRALILAGWRVIRVKSNALTPTKRQLDRAIQQILSGKEYTEIRLKDWGGK